MDDQWKNLLAAHDAVKDPDRSRAPEHSPTAAIVCCSDARVPPSVIFDQPAGSLFVVRVAGNTAGASTVASMDYAVKELGVDLIIVLGHTSCGAVAAASAGHCDGYLAPLTSQICELANNDEHLDIDELTERNVLATMTALAESDTPTGQSIQSGNVAVRGAIYDVATDEVRPLDHFSLHNALPLLRRTPQ